MHYLFLGDDFQARDRKVSELKNKILGSRDSFDFDYEILYAHKLDNGTLKKSLMALPAIASKRLVILHECHKLNPQGKKIIKAFLTDLSGSTVLLMTSEVMTEKESFVRAVAAHVKVVSLSTGYHRNVFDMTQAIQSRKPQKALLICSELMASGDHPLQIMGALVWFWGKLKMRLSKDNFNQGLRTLQEADLNIKRSRLRPEYALEVAVVKLCSLA